MSHVNIAEALMYLFPKADSTRDFRVFDYGDGAQVITEWNLKEPQPTDEELEVAWLQVVKNQKIEEYNKKCNESILAGFKSSSMGYTYGFNELDQMNMTQQLLILQLNPLTLSVYWKTEDMGVIKHTRDQFIKVAGEEAELHKRGWINYYWKLKEDILTATTVEQVESIIW